VQAGRVDVRRVRRALRRLTANHRYDELTDTLEELAREHGLKGRRLLDVPCGTGKSFEPFLRRGYEVTACDISRGSLAQARRRAGPDTRLVHADARHLPNLGEFDLVLCLDDSLNYLLDGDDLQGAFRSARRAPAPDGLFVFDVNTLGAYRTIFATTTCVERGSRFFAWQGRTDPSADPGVRAVADIAIFRDEGDGRWSRYSARHVQRHHTSEAVDSRAAAAGLAVRAAHGLTPDGTVHAEPDELAHTKRVYVARRSR
jgi:SAM-dependent methyltransferase